jgi:hypothetical protein
VEVLCKASLAALTVCPLGYRPLAERLSKLHFPSWLTRVIAFTLVFREDPMLPTGPKARLMKHVRKVGRACQPTSNVSPSTISRGDTVCAERPSLCRSSADHPYHTSSMDFWVIGGKKVPVERWGQLMYLRYLGASELL